ncbi:haloacid dehalogenase-like hydrolase [Prevotella sp. DNF00663]|uniref:HAD family hydrolase n=1 Tax=unclassified Prevotella TaxID=2638335 RepID=UPI000513D690|nr:MULTISPECIES: HAD family hydrolase [unclassified Prevotella]KGI60788.1 HAD family hydrolase [Prevotella sp. S7 MS 2]KXB82579.1 haloacid dehalogenase-like hydrolase [Prevotella sp. DNF00663]
MEKLQNIRAIAFDADDTLWDCQSHFDQVERRYCELLAEYGGAEAISASLFDVETANMDDLGYGAKAFMLSLVENAVKVSEGQVKAEIIAEILQLGRQLLHIHARPLAEVPDTLARLRACGRFRMAVFTKGELLDQEKKLHRSGLEPYFDQVAIVSDKTEKAYHQLCENLGVKTEELVMVGNSFRSDIAPVLQIGGKAVHIPFHATWQHEHMEAFVHENLRTIERFGELLNIL